MPIPSLTDQLIQLVATPSVSSHLPDWDMGNRNVIELLAAWLESIDFDIEIMPVPDRPNKANLIATRGRGPGGLVLAGHTDTVPYDANRWQQDPFTLLDRDQRFYGLGATDMKGFFPIAIEAARRFIDTPLQQPLIILATADEESSMSGARELAAQGRPQARYAVVGEPTGLKPIRMHKGIMMEAVRVRGQAGHSSNPHLGDNALETMHVVLGELLAFRRELQDKYRNPGFEIEVPTLNLGCIHGGDNPNRICGHCELQFDLRPLPGMHRDELRAQIEARLRPLGSEGAIELVSLFGGVAAYEQAPDSRLVQAAERLTGHTAASVAFATEAPFLQQLGMETIVMGPGSIDQAHQPDEFMEQKQIDPAVSLLTGLIREFCL
ncbi:acetylornithine deacetylase [Exilibacterium tricleocarpae]|uniref:Acetylornithine deacetylase n=1 Tax=Exilibacterium tricleocarpae TaxID=2591008 RepID=A0A545TKE9_9GAMM|nr:acetylornithine deacetylase [Exilibacterium tricleocarpae]TQV77641.1 acetylornithine deacetylase [Exilibacterium tricleocarpae]